MKQKITNIHYIQKLKGLMKAKVIFRIFLSHFHVILDFEPILVSIRLLILLSKFFLLIDILIDNTLNPLVCKKGCLAKPPKLAANKGRK